MSFIPLTDSEAIRAPKRANSFPDKDAKRGTVPCLYVGNDYVQLTSIFSGEERGDTTYFVVTSGDIEILLRNVAAEHPKLAKVFAECAVIASRSAMLTIHDITKMNLESTNENAPH